MSPEPIFMKKAKLVTVVISALLLSSVASASYAGMYVSGALGLNDHRFSNVSDATGFTAGVGYRPERGGLGAEISYLNAGRATISGFGDLEMSGSNISVVYWIPNDSELQYMHAYLKLGVYNMSATVAPATANSSGLSAGMGFEFSVNPKVGLYADLDGYALIDATNNNVDNLGVWSFGVRYHF
jgi:hypothetical protein